MDVSQLLMPGTVAYVLYNIYLSNNFLNLSKANTYWLKFYAVMCKNQSTFEKHGKIKYVQKHDNKNIITAHTRVKMTKYKILYSTWSYITSVSKSIFKRKLGFTCCSDTTIKITEFDLQLFYSLNIVAILYTTVAKEPCNYFIFLQS